MNKIAMGSMVVLASVAMMGQMSSVQAGWKTPGVVSFTDYADGTHAIRGSFGGVRNSSNSVEFLVCRADARSNGTRAALCTAKDAAGTTRSCNTTNATLIDAIRELDEQYVDVFYDANGTCTTILVTASSQYPGRSL
jgi:hypothetical protein